MSDQSKGLKIGQSPVRFSPRKLSEFASRLVFFAAAWAGVTQCSPSWGREALLDSSPSACEGDYSIYSIKRRPRFNAADGNKTTNTETPYFMRRVRRLLEDNRKKLGTTTQFTPSRQLRFYVSKVRINCYLSIT